MIDPNWPHGFELVCKSPNSNVGTREARLICTDRRSIHGHKYVFLVSMDNYEELLPVNEEGRILGCGENVIIRQKPEPARTFGGWVNMYGKDDDQYMKSVYPNKSDADRLSIPSRIACVYVEGTYKVGDNLS